MIHRQGDFFIGDQVKASADYTQDDLTKDGTWHDLDLTLKGVPKGAKLVFLDYRVEHSIGGEYFCLRRKGSGTIGNLGILTVSTNRHVGVIFLDCDKDGFIQYYVGAGGVWTINMTIMGWII